MVVLTRRLPRSNLSMYGEVRSSGASRLMWRFGGVQPIEAPYVFTRIQLFRFVGSGVTSSETTYAPRPWVVTRPEAIRLLNRFRILIRPRVASISGKIVVAKVAIGICGVSRRHFMSSSVAS